MMRCCAVIGQRVSPLAVVLCPAPVLLVWVWPVTAGVAGPTNMLRLSFLLHGLIDPGDITRKLWIRAH